MKALTVLQPYAYCVAIGAKTTENRRQSTNYRGPLAIHAGRYWHPAGIDDERAQWLVRRHPERLVVGAVLAVTELVDCHAADGCCGPWGDQGARLWHWKFGLTKMLPAPVPAVGHLGLWSVELDPLEILLAAAAVAGREPRVTALALCGPWFARAAFAAAPDRETVRLARIVVAQAGLGGGRVATG